MTAVLCPEFGFRPIFNQAVRQVRAVFLFSIVAMMLIISAVLSLGSLLVWYEWVDLYHWERVCPLGFV